jgi:hypothetical protein
MADLDYLLGISQIILAAILCYVTFLYARDTRSYARDTRRSIIFTKLGYFFNLYKEKNESVSLYTSKAAECKLLGKTELVEQLLSMSEKEYNLNQEILSLYFDAVDEFDKEFNLKGKFSNAIKKTYGSSKEDKERLTSLFLKAFRG